MSEIYKIIEKDIDQLDSIENWNDKVEKMKEIKERIALEQQRLNELMNVVLKNEVKTETKKKKKTSLETLVLNFKNSDNIEEKIKYYHLINTNIYEVEKQLFG